MTRLAADSVVSVSARYEALVQAKAVERDEAQVAVVAQLDALCAELVEKAQRKNGFFNRLLKLDEREETRGLYLWGAVGRGKTMLMDLFFESLPMRDKKRVHFNEFVADAHERIHIWRQKLKAGEVSGEDPIAPVAEKLAREAWILCFDEFAVTDIADAMILSRLFKALFAKGVVVVATSNVAPENLYENGLNRTLFLPFIEILRQRMDVVRLESRTDFRLEKLAGNSVFYVPADERAEEALTGAFRRLTGRSDAPPFVLTVKGHSFEVRQAFGGVARAPFSDLCARPLGASDYMALAQRFHTLILDRIPRMNFDRRNEAKRFIALIDTLYDYRVKLVASADAPVEELYEASSGGEAFEFARTVSRLIEMRSADYLSLPHGRPAEQISSGTAGLVET